MELEEFLQFLFLSIYLNLLEKPFFFFLLLLCTLSILSFPFECFPSYCFCIYSQKLLFCDVNNLGPIQPLHQLFMSLGCLSCKFQIIYNDVTIRTMSLYKFIPILASGLMCFSNTFVCLWYSTTNQTCSGNLCQGFLHLIITCRPYVIILHTWSLTCK